MARPQKLKKGKGSKKNQRKESSKSDFKDAVLDASKFLKKSAGRGDEDNEEVEFEDEELDSDDALGSEDDLDDYMADKNLKNKDANLNEYGEDEDGWDSVDEGELLTLSEIWDRDDRDQARSSKSQKSKDNDLVFDDNAESDGEEIEEENSEKDSASGSESGSESESEEDSEEESDEEDDDPFDEMNLSDDDVQLGSVMKNLKSKLPKDLKDKSKKLLINDRAAENEFSLPNLGDSLTFDDMLGDLETEDTNEDLIRDIAKHNQSLKELQAEELDDDEKHRLNDGENSAFAIPLPVNIQKRHERRAAYEIQKDQVNRWRDIIAQNRDKEVLNFTPAKVELDKNSAFKTDNDVAVNDFESKLDSIIDQSNLESKKTEDLFENIETAKLSKSEMLKRTNELRLMRELMYRGMKDSKRLKKIKSKAYRKQLRKEKLKEQMLISQVNSQDGNADDDAEEDSMYQRAKERMTLKHKNTSQWAKQMIKSGMSKDKSNRDEMEEMMRQGEKLKFKQLGKNENESSEDERDLSDLEHDVENQEQVDNSKLAKVGKGVLAMDFMKNAEERERLTKLKEIQELKGLKAAEGYENDLDGGEASAVNLTINSGRRMYTPSALVAAEEARKMDQQLLEELDEEDSRLLKNRLAVKERDNIKVVHQKKRKYSGDEADASDNEDDSANPWLMENDENGSDDDDEDDKTKSSTKLKLIDASSSKLDKSAAKIAKKLSKRKATLKKEDEENYGERTVDIQIENKESLKIVDPKRQKSKAAKSDDEYESDGDDEDDNRMFKQTDLIKQAFAGDDVLVEEFEQEKREVEEDEGDKEINLTVPGWGSWAGADEGADDGWGVPKSKKRKVVKTIQGVVSKDQRKDKGKANVIINEKVNKKNTKYQADKVPYPYKTWEEYERSLRIPMGKEWATAKTHQKLITPSVITKFGSVIDPLKATFNDN